MWDPGRWIEPYFRDSTLWPVLAVVVAIAVTLVATLLVLAVADRNLAALAGLLALVWMSVDASLRERRARGRVGLVGRMILALWVLGGLAAFAARRGGLL